MTIEETDRPTLQLDVLLPPADLRVALENDARNGLSATPKSLPPKYFYDDRGSALFEQITGLPEYYPTRTERAILTEYADEIADAAGAGVLLELGSGSSAKTRLLLDALARTGRVTHYVPVDVSSGALAEAMDALRQEYPDLALHGVVADFDHHLARLPAPGRRLVAFLGGTIGNFPPAQRRAFLGRLAASMSPGETLLLGIDLVKEPSRLVAAYDDSAGVTAAFNRNVIDVLNREFDGDLDAERFEHQALWDAENEWIEMRLRATAELTGRLAAIDLPVRFEAGEELRTEVSAKFTRQRIEPELAGAGLSLEQWWTDPAEDFAVLLARRT